MRVLPVIERIASECPILAGRVYPARQTTALPDTDDGVPAAHVRTGTDKAADNEMDGICVRQNMESLVVVGVIAQNVDADAGTEQIEDVRDQLNAALIGWQGSYEQPLTYVGSEPQQIDGDYVWHAFVYSVGFII